MNLFISGVITIGMDTDLSLKVKLAADMNGDKIKWLEKRIEELRKQWPAHSVPPAMLMQLDELEEELERAKKEKEANSS